METTSRLMYAHFSYNENYFNTYHILIYLLLIRLCVVKAGAYKIPSPISCFFFSRNSHSKCSTTLFLIKNVRYNIFYLHS